MLKAIAVIFGATGLQVVTTVLEIRSGAAGDLIRLAAFVGALLFVISVAPGASERSRRTARIDDERFAGFDRRVVTLSLRAAETERRRQRSAAPAE